MSFTSSALAPATLAINSARGLLRGGSLQSMVRTLGVIVGAGVLAASYQIATEEGRALVQNIRTGSAHRRARNTAVVLVLLNSKLPLELQDRFRRSRDAVRTGLTMLTDGSLPPEHHGIIHSALAKVTQGGSPGEC